MMRESKVLPIQGENVEYGTCIIWYEQKIVDFNKIIIPNNDNLKFVVLPPNYMKGIIVCEEFLWSNQNE